MRIHILTYKTLKIFVENNTEPIVYISQGRNQSEYVLTIENSKLVRFKQGTVKHKPILEAPKMVYDFFKNEQKALFAKLKEYGKMPA